MTLDMLDELAQIYVETFNTEPWNDQWKVETARRRLFQMIQVEDFDGMVLMGKSI